MFREAGKAITNHKGMTMLETLITVALIAMISAVVAASIPTVQNAYEKTVLAANAEVLMNTAVTALRNELGTARKVTADQESVSFYNEGLNSESRIRKAGAADTDYIAGTILYQRYLSDQAAANSGYNQSDPLLSGQPYSSDMYVTYDSVTLDQGIVTFHNLKVMVPSRKVPLTQQAKVSVRTGG